MVDSPISKPIVLYVDDISANLMLFEASFEEYFTVHLAESGNQALSILKEKNDIAVVVSDQNMPGMSGNELLEIVSREYPFIMRFMITAYTDYETVVDAVNKGQIYGFFNKPYNVDDVRLSIERSLEVRELRLKNHQMIADLEELNEQLLSTDRTKTAFLKSITNEIRTPISRITTAMHVLKDKIDSSELTELIHMLDFSVSRLESFTYAADQLVKLRGAEFSINSSSVSLREVIDIAVIEKKQLLNDEQLKFRLEELVEKPQVNGELGLLVICFNALLDYCATHSKEGTELVFRLGRENGMYMQSIIDAGSKMSDEDFQLLSKFFGSDGSDSEDHIPLELILVQQIMNAHKGRVKISSSGDQGKEFGLLFPVPGSSEKA